MKPFFLSGIFVLLSIFTAAQTLKELYEQSVALEKNGNYKEAALIREKIVTAALAEFGEEHSNYFGSLLSLGVCYYETQQYEKAETIYNKAIGLLKKICGAEHSDYASGLINLANLYQKTGQYAKAEPLFITAGEILKKSTGENSTKYTKYLNSFAVLYERMGQYTKAEGLYIKTIEIQEKSIGKEHVDYTLSQNNLAILYSRMGQYVKAEPLFLQAIEIRKKIVGEGHALYAGSLQDLGSLYTSMGLFDKAEPLLIQSLALRKKNLGENHYDYAQAVSNLGIMYAIMGQLDKAEPFFIESVERIKKILGENHPDYATNINNLAILYTNKRQYDKAAPLLAEAIEKRKKSLGENHPYYASGLEGLAALYVEMGDYEKAVTLSDRVRAIQSKTLGENHPEYAHNIYNLALIYNRMGDYEKAEHLLIKATGIALNNIRKTFTILSEKEKANFITQNEYLLLRGHSFSYSHRQSSVPIHTNNYNNQLFFKSLSLADTKNMLETVRESKDTIIQKLFNSWQAEKMLLAKQYSLPVAKRFAGLDSIETLTEAREKELTRRSFEFRKQQAAINIEVPVLFKNLKEEEAAIEFVSFQFLTTKRTDSLIYAAYILRKSDSIPVFVPLFEEKQLQKILDSTDKTTTAAIVNGFYRGFKVKNKNTPSLGQDLYNLIWQPLEPYLKGIKNITYSPSGKLYNIAFHALPVDSTVILMDKYKLQQYTSTRQVVLRNAEKGVPKPQNIVLFGNASFTLDSLQLAKQYKAEKQDAAFLMNRTTPDTRGAANNSWQDLPGTATEINKIQQLFDRKKIRAESFLKTNASEGNLKLLSGKSPQVLHIATHGFFLSKPGKENNSQGNSNAQIAADDPLLRTGLILSGGNYAWSGKTPIDGVEDGIVTAYEISQLNLSNTELVVLSACETALGDVKGSEGVFGLQRAFKMAGVKKMIVSLWQVPDKETAELMTAFYSYWMKGKTISDAFAQAQADMRKKYSPFYWAAFVLVE